MESTTSIPNKALVLDLVRWVSEKPRPYDEVMAAWRTSCPKLPIWEDAVDLGFVARVRDTGGPLVVKVTPRGEAFLRSERSLVRTATGPASTPTLSA